MLTQIYIKDLVTIEKACLQLNTGSTMITGETGAGKSIFIEAIEIALGGRRSMANLVRLGADKAEISLCFDITLFSHVKSRLQALELLNENCECVIRRVISKEGKSKSFINDSPVSLQLIKELGETLFHLHGQHEQQFLLKSDAQRDLLDRFGHYSHLTLQVASTAMNYKHLQQTLNNLTAKAEASQQQQQFLAFQLQELANLKLSVDEWQTLEKEHSRLSHAEDLLKNIDHTLQAFNQDFEASINNQLQQLRRHLESMQPMETQSAEWLTLLNQAQLHLTELETQLQDYLAHTDLDAERLTLVEKRLSQLYDIARKYKIKPENLYDYTQQIQLELANIDAYTEQLAQLEKQIAASHADYLQHANALHTARIETAALLEQEVLQTVRQLALPHADLKIGVQQDATVISPYGQDKITFLMKTNPEHDLQPIAKILSGGELSRLSLALHLALANRISIPTLVFDEVDTGLSGATAEKIGKLLHQLGKTYQVFCITHHAQVAACGDQHILVEKHIANGKTLTQLKKLNRDEKTHEIARMLSGEKLTATTLQHAREMMDDIHAAV